MDEADIPWTGSGGKLWVMDQGKENEMFPSDHAWLGNGVLACRFTDGVVYFGPNGWLRFEPEREADPVAVQTQAIIEELDAQES